MCLSILILRAVVTIGPSFQRSDWIATRKIMSLGYDIPLPLFGGPSEIFLSP